MSGIDHLVRFMDEFAIVQVATACWKIGTPPGTNAVNLETILIELQEHGVESIHALKWMKKKGRLKLVIIEDDTREFPAYVKFSPSLTLFVQKTVWDRFKKGYPEERVIIAHEIGHIMLHNDEAKPFTRDRNLELKYGTEGDSAERQANSFADHLLIPTPIVEKITNVARLAFACNVPDRFASERYTTVALAKKPITTVFDFNPCPSCERFTLSFLTDPAKCECGFVAGKAV